MEISRRGALFGLFAAPAIIKAESLMKMSRALIVPVGPADFSTDQLIYKSTERYARGFMDYRLFRQLVEPALREHFDGVYNERGEEYRAVFGAGPAGCPRPALWRRGGGYAQWRARSDRVELSRAAAVHRQGDQAMGHAGDKGPPDGPEGLRSKLQTYFSVRGDRAGAGQSWETSERDEEIDGWKIRLSGHRGAFYVQDSHLAGMGMTLTQYIGWLRGSYPHREMPLDS
jgi:hypothetical protein